MSRSDRSMAKRTALTGVLAAGGMAVLWVACLVPSGRIGLAAAAGLFPVVAVLADGRTTGLLCWATTTILGLILLPSKEIAVLFGVFLGLYPVVKSKIEQLNKQMLEWPCKLLYFNAAFALFWLGFQALFLQNLPVWLEENIILLFFAANVVFLIYDIGLSKLIALMSSRFKGWYRH